MREPDHEHRRVSAEEARRDHVVQPSPAAIARAGADRWGLQSILALQRTAGNAAVSTMLLRQADAAPSLLPSPKREPIALAAKQVGADDGRAELRPRADALLAEAKQTMADVTAFQERATAEMGRVHKQVVAYLVTYRRAHVRVMTDLGKAKAAAQSRDALLGAVSSILVGTGVGLVLPRLIDGYRKMRTVGKLANLKLADATIAEATGETIEAGAAAVMGGGTGGFDLPPELSADLVASAQWQQLAEGWKTLAEVAPSITAFGNARYDLLERLHGSASAEQLRTAVEEWAKRDTLAQMRAAMTETDDALATFVAVMDSPILRRNEYSIGQDMLIKWMVGLTTVNPRFPKYVDADDLDPIDDAERVLADWGILSGPLGSAPADATRLGVDFGPRWTSDNDQVAGYRAAVKEKHRIEQIGRLGVIIRAANGKLRPLVSLQHSVYGVVGLPDPQPGATEGIFACEGSWDPLVVGQVVAVAGTQLKRLLVEPVKGAPNIPYGPVQLHPRTARAQEKERAAKERAAKVDYGPIPVDDSELERHGLDPAEARFLPDEVLESVYGLPGRGRGPLLPPPYAPPAPPPGEPAPDPAEPASGQDDAPFCLPPDEVDASVSPDDPRLDPDAVELCFGEPAPA